MADIEEATSNDIDNGASSAKRKLKMTEFLIDKMLLVLENKDSDAVSKWNFITAFFITLGVNRNAGIRELGIKAIGTFVRNTLKNECKSPPAQKQTDIIALYLELSKSQVKEF